MNRPPPSRSRHGAAGTRHRVSDSPDNGDTDPVVIDLNVDAALALKTMIGIDEYPAVLALTPNIFRAEDAALVHGVMVDELTRAGIVTDGRVHPRVEHWLRCLDRPDMELVARIADTAYGAQPGSLLRLSLVRCNETHVLALRCGDRVAIQPVFQQGRQMAPVVAALTSALGPARALGFESLTATFQQLDAVPAEPEERRRALLELGATAHTAAVLTRALDDIRRRAEVLVIEHRDGTPARAQYSMSVLDTGLGRIVITPRIAADDGTWCTYARGDEASVRAGIIALLELLPGRSWFDTARTD